MDPRELFPMETCVGETRAVGNTASTGPRELVRQVIAMLEAAVGQLDHEQTVHGTILKAASLLRKQIDLEVAGAAPHTRGSLLAWQARKVRAYIDSHMTGPVLVAELCALVRLSKAHFSRAFRRTFGNSPRAFVIRRRVELAAQYMLETEAPLSDIALQCGFSDQPHLCKLFRRTTGHTPAAWRRARSSKDVRPVLPYSGDREIPRLSARISQQDLLMNGPLQLRKESYYMNPSKPRNPS